MSSNPQKPAPPPLMDSPDAREIYASEVVGTGSIGNSVAVSLAAHRWVVPELGGDMQLARVVVARLVLSNDAAVQLSRRLAALARPNVPQPVNMGRMVTGQIPNLPQARVSRPVPQAGPVQTVTIAKPQADAKTRPARAVIQHAIAKKPAAKSSTKASAKSRATASRGRKKSRSR